MKHDRIIMAIAVVLIAAVLIGEVVVYTSDTDSFSVDAEYDGDSVNYSVSVSGSQPYTAVVTENGMAPMTELYIFCDERYASCFEAERGPIGSKPLDQNVYIDLFTTALSYASGLPVRILSADELREILSADVDNGEMQKGLLVISGALPDTIYTGSSDDLIFDWLDSGGRLYWLGNVLGKYVSTASGLTDISETTPDYQKLFFGTECLNSDNEGTGFVSDDFSGGPVDELRHALSLKNNRIKFGVSTVELDSANVNYRAFGYSDAENNYASIVLTEHGNGMICVLAGDLSRNQRSDLVQIVSSGIDPSAEVLGIEEGSVRNGTHNGEIAIDRSVSNLTAYIYLGGYYSVYGRSISL